MLQGILGRTIRSIGNNIRGRAFDLAASIEAVKVIENHG